MKYTQSMIECDNPSCNNAYPHTKDDPAPGYHLGKGEWCNAGGGPIPAFYACDIECVKPALLDVIEY